MDEWMMAFGLDASRKMIGLFFNHLGKSWRCSGAERPTGQQV